MDGDKPGETAGVPGRNSSRVPPNTIRSVISDPALLIVSSASDPHSSANKEMFNCRMLAFHFYDLPHIPQRPHYATAVAQWLRCCATNRKVAGSIPAGVTEFFIDIKSFRSHYNPGVDSARSICWR